MAFDGIVTKAITSELSNLSNARIDKIYQPNKNTIILGIYLNGNNYALNICIDAQNCRINLTTHNKTNPQVAPNFCMLLRKNLIGLRIKNIFSLELERLIILDFEGFDDVDDIISKKLIIELMGKHSNIILIDDNNIIIDSLRHIKEIDENYRDILPHTKYTFPVSNKFNFLNLNNFEDFTKVLSASDLDHFFKNTTLETLPITISSTFNGISKNFINSIIKKFNIMTLDIENLKIIFDYITNVINNISTNNLYFEKIYNSDNVLKDFYLAYTSNNITNKDITFSLNFFIDDFYYFKEVNEDFKNLRNSLLKLIFDTLKKYQKRLYNIDEKLKECNDMNKYKLYGELITANLYKIPNKNLDFVEIENYYDNNNTIRIPLNKCYTPSINAKKFFKKYSKLKNALEIVSIQKGDTLKELDYIESVVYELENCSTLDDISVIFDEICENDIFKNKTSNLTNKSKKTKIKKSKFTKNKTVSFNPIKYTVDGYTILVGRNNKENDYLSLKYAHKNDIWFHTKDFHGSHTILKLDTDKPFPDLEVLYKAASIAAKHSKAKDSSHVPVDYCEVKYIKKPSGSKPRHGYLYKL